MTTVRSPARALRVFQKRTVRLHRRGNERAWWQSQGIDPLAIAANLWANTHAAEPAAADVVGETDRPTNALFNGNETSGVAWPQNSETNPIPRPEAS
jgi:hypothetical protein